MAARSVGITPAQFVEKWAKVELSERAAGHEHFIDLCHMLGQPTPAEADPTVSRYLRLHAGIGRQALRNLTGRLDSSRWSNAPAPDRARNGSRGRDLD